MTGRLDVTRDTETNQLSSTAKKDTRFNSQQQVRRQGEISHETKRTSSKKPRWTNEEKGESSRSHIELQTRDPRGLQMWLLIDPRVGAFCLGGRKGLRWCVHLNFHFKSIKKNCCLIVHLCIAPPLGMLTRLCHVCRTQNRLCLKNKFSEQKNDGILVFRSVCWKFLRLQLMATKNTFSKVWSAFVPNTRSPSFCLTLSITFFRADATSVLASFYFYFTNFCLFLKHVHGLVQEE